MKWIEGSNPDAVLGLPTVELTRRNLLTLLAKLDDPLSARALVDGDQQVAVRGVEDGPEGRDAGVALIAVRPVEDAEHYVDRSPGIVFMPTAGQYL